MTRRKTAVCAAGLLLAATAALAEYADRSTSALQSELRNVERELATFRDYETKLQRSERQSSNTARASVIDALQQHMIDIVLRREDALGVEHTIIRHGQPPSDPTAAAEVGTPMSNKETRRRMSKGTSDKSSAFLRMSRMQGQVVSGERIYRQAVEKQDGAFATYTAIVADFGKVLDNEHRGLLAELERREQEAKAATADTLYGAE